jgi:dipeptidase E
MTKRQILAFGGGGFSMEPENPALEKYLLGRVETPNPQVCFLPTASGDAESYVFKFYEAFLKLDCRPSYLSLFRLPDADLEKFVLEKDILYVGGGNTRSMLALWREWGLDRILRAAYDRGVVLAGISAGANCWFEECITDSVPGDLRPLRCLGFLRGSFCPHYDGEAQRRPAFHRLLTESKILPGYAADDGAAVHFVDGEPFAMVSSRPDARVYKLSKSRGKVVEEIQDSRYLNS